MNDKTNTNEAAHCGLGPSTLPPRAVCPCHQACKGGEDANSGTRAHRVVEGVLTGKGGDGFWLPGTTEDEKARGFWGASQIMKLRDETSPNAMILSEARERFVEHDNYEPAALVAWIGKFGTVDAHWDGDDDTLYIADFKTYATADGEKSYLPQGMAYAVLLDSNSSSPYKRAVFFVVAGGDRTVARYEFTLAEAIDETTKIIRRVDSTRDLFGEDGEKARKACGKPSVWCKTCAHAADCPAISRAVAVVSSGGAEILRRPLAVRMAIIPVLESFCKGVKAEVRARLDAGERVADEVSGIEYALAERRGKAKLADLRGLAESVIVYGVKPDDFASAVSISKNAVDGLLKAVDDANGRKVKKADREAVYVRYFTEPGMERYVKRIS